MRRQEAAAGPAAMREARRCFPAVGAGCRGHRPGTHDHVMAMAEPMFPARGRCGSDCAWLPPLAGVKVAMEVVAAPSYAMESFEPALLICPHW